MVSVQYHSDGTLWENRASTGVAVTLPAQGTTYWAKDANDTAYLYIYLLNANYDATSNDMNLQYSTNSPTQPPGFWRVLRAEAQSTVGTASEPVYQS